MDEEISGVIDDLISGVVFSAVAAAGGGMSWGDGTLVTAGDGTQLDWSAP